VAAPDDQVDEASASGTSRCDERYMAQRIAGEYKFAPGSLIKM
jgi:hypothetical protein